MVASLQEIARTMMGEGKGILAADASAGSMNKRLREVGVEEDEESRRRYRQLLFSTPELTNYVSGVILYDGTMRQSTDDGEPFGLMLERLGMIPGIKVDKGKVDLPNFSGEQVTEGLDGLGMRLDEYYELGARFTKWRAVIHIGDGLPTPEALRANAHALARYAALVEETHMVPIIEPEVLLDGDHSIETCGEVLQTTLATVFEELMMYRVSLNSTILKTSMVLPGKDSGIKATPQEVARETVRTLVASVPATTAGVVFLSGGQEPIEATENLQAIAQLGKQPWPMTFSYSRALQEPVLEAWRGSDKNTHEAQQAFLHRLACNVAAREGRYAAEME